MITFTSKTIPTVLPRVIELGSSVFERIVHTNPDGKVVVYYQDPKDASDLGTLFRWHGIGLTESEADEDIRSKVSKSYELKTLTYKVIL